MKKGVETPTSTPAPVPPSRARLLYVERDALSAVPTIPSPRLPPPVPDSPKDSILSNSQDAHKINKHVAPHSRPRPASFFHSRRAQDLIGLSWAYRFEVKAGYSLPLTCASAYCEYDLLGETFTTETVQPDPPSHSPTLNYSFVHRVDKVRACRKGIEFGAPDIVANASPSPGFLTAEYCEIGPYFVGESC